MAKLKTAQLTSINYKLVEFFSGRCTHQCAPYRVWKRNQAKHSQTVQNIRRRDECLLDGKLGRRMEASLSSGYSVMLVIWQTLLAAEL